MNWEEVDGYFEPMHQKQYQKLAEQVPAGGILVEVGCFRGRSLCSIAETVKARNIQLVAVDMFDNVAYTYDEPNVTEKAKGMNEDFLKNVNEFYGQRSMLIFRMPSVLAANAFSKCYPETKLDMVFLDAAHDYESVKADIEAWWPLVKSGGILSGHDYGKLWPGVVKAVTECFGDSALNEDEVWWIKKI